MMRRRPSPALHRFEGRKVDHEQRSQGVVRVGSSQVETEGTEDGGDRPPGVGGEQQHVPGTAGEPLTDGRHFIRGEELGDRRTERVVGLDHHPYQSLCTQLLGPFGEGVHSGASCFLPAGVDATYHPARRHRRGEGGEPAAGQGVGEVHDLSAKADVGLVASVPVHRLVPGHAGKWGRQLYSPHLPGHRSHHRLEDVEDIVAVPEGAFEVELRELDLTVGAEVLIPIALGHLVVPLHPGHHQQLFEQLRALGQSVEGALLVAARHQHVPGPFRRRGDEGGGLDLEKPEFVHHPPHDRHRLGAGLEVGRHRGPAQIEIPVLEPDPLVEFDPVLDHERQRFRRGEDDQIVGLHLDLAGRKVEVDGSFRPGLDGAGDGDAVLHLQTGGGRYGRGVEHHLDEPGAVPQVDEDDSPHVPPALNPPGQPLRPADGAGGVESVDTAIPSRHGHSWSERRPDHPAPPLVVSGRPGP